MSRQFLGIPRHAIDDRRLSWGDRELLSVLCSYLTKERPDYCYPSKDTLGKRLDVNKDTVKSRLSSLRNAGYISRPKPNSGRSPGDIFIHFDVDVPDEFFRGNRRSEPDSDALGGVSDHPPEDTSGGDETPPQRFRGGAETPRQKVRGGVSTPSRGGDQTPPKLLKGDIKTGGEARAHACETDPHAQSPPDPIDDFDKKNGSDRSARVLLPEVLPDDFRRIAENEFDGVDDLTGRFERFAKKFSTNSITWDEWLDRWRTWIGRDFAKADPAKPRRVTNGQANVSAPVVNGHDPPLTRGKGGLANFGRRILDLCSEEKKKVSKTGELMGDEEIKFKIQIGQIYEGRNVVLGVAWGPNLTADEVFARLPEFDANAAK